MMMLRWLVSFDSCPRCHGSIVSSPFDVRVAVAGVEAWTADGAISAARRIMRHAPATPHPSIPHGVLVGILDHVRVTELSRWPSGLDPVVSFFTPTDRKTRAVLAGKKAAELLASIPRNKHVGFPLS